MLPIVEIEDIASHFAKSCRTGGPARNRDPSRHIAECNVFDRREDNPARVEGVRVIIGQGRSERVGKIELELGADGFLRISYATSMENLERAVGAMKSIFGVRAIGDG